MSIQECATLNHSAFHILGRVHQSSEQTERVLALRTNNPGATVNADANWLRSRMSLVTAATHLEHRRRHSARGSKMAIDHPRSIAIQKAIEQDVSWGILPETAGATCPLPQRMQLKIAA